MKKTETTSHLNAYAYLRKFISEATIMTDKEEEIYKQIVQKFNFLVKSPVSKAQRDARTVESFFGPASEALTATEARILKYLCAGYSYQDCEKIFKIKPCTLRTHVHNLYLKKHVNSLQELIVLELTGQLKGKPLNGNIKTSITTSNQESDEMQLLNNLLK